MAVTTYSVKGMTCAHCVQAVSGSVGQLAGVNAVHVDLAAGTVRVDSDGPLDPQVVRDAVDDAGYEVVGDPA